MGNNESPKHLTTFIDDVIEFISFMSNRSSGAVGIPNVLVWTMYFLRKDTESGYVNKNPDYYIRQAFQKLIYRLNQPFMRIDQSAFVNMSVFDRKYAEALFGGLEYPDGTFFVDYIEDFMQHQKIFMEVVKEVRKQNMFTFPVLTCSLIYKDGKFEDEEFARYCSDNNCEYNDYNFFTSDSVTSLSNCPLGGETKIVYWSDRYSKFIASPIKEAYHNFVSNGKKYIEVISKGKRIKCRINSFKIPANYRITLVNGATFTTTADHLNKVLGKNYVASKDLTVNDYLPYSLVPFTERESLHYEQGKLIGMFLGDGSFSNSNEVVFSLNRETDKDDIAFLKNYCEREYNAQVNEYYCKSTLSGKDKCVNVRIKSQALRGLIKQFVLGDKAANKELSLEALSCSISFRTGIIDGLYTTDGGNNNRIYTSSENLKDSLILLFSSLGIVTRVNSDNREGRLSSRTCYTIRWYTPNSRTSLKDVYVIDSDFMWVKIQSIEILKTAGKTTSYCLEVLDDVEPVFMLANGVHTHNCRLISDTSRLDAFINSIGGTALSIGSVKVNTINLMRIAYDAKNKSDYLKKLESAALLCCKTLDIVRHIIKRNVEKGLLPNYCDGGVEMSKQYSTVGILGLYEVIEFFGFTAKDEFGNISYTDDGIAFAKQIFEVLNRVKDGFTKDYSFNIESVPAERAAVILCQKDNLLFERHDKFIYSNQWIPLSEKCTIKEKIRLSSILDPLCSGGAIAHINLEAPFANTETAWKMLNYIASNKVFYFAFNIRINECCHHHGFVGTPICPVCGEGVIDSYQRIVGYLVPTRAYSKDRFKEFNTRQWYSHAEMLRDV